MVHEINNHKLNLLKDNFFQTQFPFLYFYALVKLIYSIPQQNKLILICMQKLSN